jgi:hypothetical protein
MVAGGFSNDGAAALNVVFKYFVSKATKKEALLSCASDLLARRLSDMPLFDAYIMTDWSGGSRRRKNRQDAIWIAHGDIEDDFAANRKPTFTN